MKLIIDKGLNNCPNKQLQEEFDRLCDEQEAIDNTGFGKVFECLNEEILQGAKHPVLFPYTDNVEAIQKALEKTGHSNDEAFCARFMKSYRLFVKGKEIQAQGLGVIASTLPQFGKQAGGFYFVPISIIAPKEQASIQQAIKEVLEADAKAGKGLFTNVTNISKEDEALDTLLCVEAYNCKHSFTKWLDVLKRYNVAGKQGAFLDESFTRFLFEQVSGCAKVIKDNTDSPNKVKNSLNDIITMLDALPIWGLFFQILILQGLCTMLESIDINEGQSGFDEAQSLYDWLAEALTHKVMLFSCGYYGDKDLLTLQPFCEYLCTTAAGEAVQQWIKAKYYTEQRETAPQQQENPQAGNCKEEQTEATQKPQNKQRGRKAKPFSSCLLGDEAQKAATLKALHTLLQGKSGKDVVLIVAAGIKAGKITKPTFMAVTNEFGDIGSKQAYNNLLNAYNKDLPVFTKDEIQGAITALETAITTQ